jgi:cytidyltransferase-like protein
VFRYLDRGATVAYCPEGRVRRDWPRDVLLPTATATFEGVAVGIPHHADRMLDELFPNWRIDFDSGAWNHRLERRRWRRKRYLWNPAGVRLPRGKAVVYADMCADLFHAGHVNFLRQARALGTRLVVGVHGDATIASYKRPPVQPLAERVAAVAGCRHVDQVVPDAPLVVTPRYLDALGARIVCHGDEIAPADLDRMYGLVAATHRIVLVPYTPGISTRALCDRVLDRERGDDPSSARSRAQPVAQSNAQSVAQPDAQWGAQPSAQSGDPADASGTSRQ